ncbi:MAG: aspartyl/glutamyl-tRNA amidotransferase subunit C [Spirochaetaceae bacterium]|jgi:aspartyl-tRNA(Asn)/glutamyl-tRNA(Gln) amidotransferase subunit C|nr:aspartyl/glutamyl-tRNA amidotransferase subunit C [Spirochaetaceae bacterium]
MDIEELRVSAELAHIKLDEAELSEAFPAFEQILSFFSAMQAADNDGTLICEESSHAPPADSTWFRRDDQSGQDEGKCKAPSCTDVLVDIDPAVLIQKAGETDGRFIVIPNVL